MSLLRSKSTYRVQKRLSPDNSEYLFIGPQLQLCTEASMCYCESRHGGYKDKGNAVLALTRSPMKVHIAP